MTSLKVPEDQPIESGMVTRAVLQAQSKIEGMNFDARKHLLDYDDVLNKQRQAVYKMRQEMLEQNANPQILQALDFFWMTHLDDMEHLSQSVRLRAYGQHDPLVEYRREGHKLYQEMMENFEQWKTENLKTQNPNDKQIQNIKLEIPNTTQEKYPGTGRNDPCPCGSGKKYKKCHGA